MIAQSVRSWFWKLATVALVLLPVVVAAYVHVERTGSFNVVTAPFTTPGYILTASLSTGGPRMHVLRVSFSWLVWSVAGTYLLTLAKTVRTHEGLRKALGLIAVPCLLFALLSYWHENTLDAQGNPFDWGPFFWFLLPGGLLDVYLSGNVHGGFRRPLGDVIQIAGAVAFWSLSIWYTGRVVAWFHGKVKKGTNRLTTA